MWFANQEQMSNWILLPKGEQGFFENLHREYWSRLDQKALERLKGGDTNERSASRRYLVSHRTNTTIESGPEKLVPRL